MDSVVPDVTRIDSRTRRRTTIQKLGNGRDMTSGGDRIRRDVNRVTENFITGARIEASAAHWRKMVPSACDALERRISMKNYHTVNIE